MKPNNPRGMGHRAALAVPLGVALLTALPAYAFTSIGSLGTPRDGFTTTLLPNSKVLVAGGYDGTNQLSGAELYDPATGKWQPTGQMLSRRSIHTATLLPNGKVLVAGGYNGTNRVAGTELYDPATGLWTPTGALQTARANHTATLLLRGDVLIAGGSDDSMVLDSAEIYNMSTGTWTIGGLMTGSRAGHTATLLSNGRVLVAGGEGSAGGFSAELYDISRGTWVATGSMSETRTEHTATLLPNGRVLVAGGGWEDPFLGQQSIAITELYDPSTGTWTTTAPLTESRFGHTATLLPNGNVVVAGGRLEEGFLGQTLSSGEFYNPVSATWAPAGSMAVGRLYHSAMLLASGQILMVAGFNYQDGDLSSAELYDSTVNPTTGNWKDTGSMIEGRATHTATLLTSGQVLVVGGDFYDGVNWDAIGSAELYDPLTETWGETAPLTEPRVGHRAVLLPTGKVLVVGGFTSSGWLTNSELYDPIGRSWATIGGSPGLGGALTATLLHTGKVLVTGGFTNGGSAVVPAAMLFDPVTGKWSNTGSMLEPRARHTATLLPNGQVLVAGGFNSTVLSSAELYDPAIGIWRTAGSMTYARKGHTATLLPNGIVLVVTTDFDGPGGSMARSTGELYDPTTGSWSVTGSLFHGRAEASATLLPNGQVLLAGGADYDAIASCSPLAELYDPASGVWKLTGQLTAGTQDSTATLLASGKVLLTGGCRGLQSAELYDVGLGFDASWKPQITNATAPLTLGSSLVLGGLGFRGNSEASGGNGCQNSGSDFPLVQLRSLEGDQSAFLLPTYWSTNWFVSAPVSGFPPGLALATIFVNGIPSTSSILEVTSPQLVQAPILTGPSKLPNGSFRFGFTNAPGLVFSVLAATNAALSSANWTLVGESSEISPGRFQFTDIEATNYPGRFYRVRSQ